MTSDGSNRKGAGDRSLLGAVRAAPGMAGRVAHLESEVDQLRRRVDELEGTAAALDVVRDDVRSLTETLTEELNRLAADRPAGPG